jgi:hypothetical protein
MPLDRSRQCSGTFLGVVQVHAHPGDALWIERAGLLELLDAAGGNDHLRAFPRKAQCHALTIPVPAPLIEAIFPSSIPMAFPSGLGDTWLRHSFL